MTYCQTSDVNQYLNQIGVKSGQSVSSFIQDAADLMHMKAVGIYQIPFQVDMNLVDSLTSGATTRMLQTMNAKLAAGYTILAGTITQERDNVHAYARTLIDETMSFLDDMSDQMIVIPGLKADENRADDFARPTKILISNPDGKDTATDSKSFFNRPYTDIGNRAKKVTGGPEI